MNKVYILLGANLGNPNRQLEKSRLHLESRLGNLITASSLYQSEAWGLEDQPIFLNQVLLYQTTFTAQECLSICQQTEDELGRVRKEKWGARVIDIDILYFNSEIVETPQLHIPHPYIQDRKFTLMPLVEISPDYIHPKLKLSNKQLLLNCDDKLKVNKI